MAEQREGALSVYRVLDLADIKGAYCTKLLADQGAEVIKIEKPKRGCPTRDTPPFAGVSSLKSPPQHLHLAMADV